MARLYGTEVIIPEGHRSLRQGLHWIPCFVKSFQGWGLWAERILNWLSQSTKYEVFFVGTFTEPRASESYLSQEGQTG